jgi:GNAT superfamily N-acetyltransferase|tara:strand:+ start:136 stop:987 length:852 start_codon:yes stop_codon:yes gene_type:complete
MLQNLRPLLSENPQQPDCRKIRAMGCLCSRVAPLGLWDPVASTSGIRKVPSPNGPDAVAAVDISTRSFAGTATSEPELLLDWALGENLRNKWDHPDRVKHLGWILRVVIGTALRAGQNRAVFLGLTDNGEPGAAITVRFLPRKPNATFEVCRNLTEMCCRAGFPAFDATNGMSRRVEAADDALENLHRKHARAADTYVQLMAVAPEHQGQRLCSKLMRAVCLVADAKNLPARLETSGAKNVAVYEKFGFKTVERVTVRDPGDKNALAFDHFDAMVRVPSQVPA